MLGFSWNGSMMLYVLKDTFHLIIASDVHRMNISSHYTLRTHIGNFMLENALVQVKKSNKVSYNYTNNELSDFHVFMFHCLLSTWLLHKQIVAAINCVFDRFINMIFKICDA